MHVPDGFIAPIVSLPASAAAAVVWLSSLKSMRSRLRTSAVPLLAALAAAMFVLMTVALPLPGGTSAHATGVGLLALRFPGLIVFAVTALVLFLQAVLIGQGGITTIGISAIALGLCGGFVARLCVRLPVPDPLRALLAGSLSVLVAALVMATVLGLQPLLGSSAAGVPLYFPFPLSVTVPVIMGAHLPVAAAEGLLTVAADRLLVRLQQARDSG